MGFDQQILEKTLEIHDFPRVFHGLSSWTLPFFGEFPSGLITNTVSPTPTNVRIQHVAEHQHTLAQHRTKQNIFLSEHNIEHPTLQHPTPNIQHLPAGRPAGQPAGINEIYNLGVVPDLQISKIVELLMIYIHLLAFVLIYVCCFLYWSLTICYKMGWEWEGEAESGSNV